jgi:hypothetical protein
MGVRWVYVQSECTRAPANPSTHALRPPATSPAISVANTLHVITVGREELGLCLANAQGHFLGPGRHAICHPRFEFRGLQSAKSEYLSVGAKHRVFLAEGRLGLAWEGGRPLVLEPKEDRTPHCFDSSTFAFERSVPATQQVIVHGSVKVITVRQGFVGVSFRNGALEVLPPGRCILDSVTHAFSGFLPTGQQTLQLESVDGMTSDNVGLKFDAAICVQVTDAKKAIAMLASSTATACHLRKASGLPLKKNRKEGGMRAACAQAVTRGGALHTLTMEM